MGTGGKGQAMRVECPACHKTLHIAGKASKVKCRLCRATFTRPTPQEAPPAAPAAAAASPSDEATAGPPGSHGRRRRTHRDEQPWAPLAPLGGLIAGAAVGFGLAAWGDWMVGAPDPSYRVWLAPPLCAVGSALIAVAAAKPGWFLRGWRAELIKKVVGRASTRAAYAVVGVIALLAGMFLAVMPALPVLLPYRHQAPIE